MKSRREGPVLLCIDDNPAALKLRTLVLSNAGYAVLTATNGSAGLHLFTHNHIDLVISDHVLPDVPGDQLIEEMKRVKPHVPFLMLSGLPEAPEGVERKLFISKDMSLPDFLDTIRRLLEGRAASAVSPHE